MFNIQVSVTKKVSKRGEDKENEGRGRNTKSRLLKDSNNAKFLNKGEVIMQFLYDLFCYNLFLLRVNNCCNDWFDLDPIPSNY